MAVFRVERNKDYTVMSNHHLRNKEPTLKAKWLLSQMLSLPEDWDYTLAGLSQINQEGINAIRTAVWELEKAGDIARRQGRDEKGKMTAIEYTIYEQPQPPERKRKEAEKSFVIGGKEITAKLLSEALHSLSDEKLETVQNIEKELVLKSLCANKKRNSFVGVIILISGFLLNFMAILLCNTTINMKEICQMLSICTKEKCQTVSFIRMIHRIPALFYIQMAKCSIKYPK